MIRVALKQHGRYVGIDPNDPAAVVYADRTARGPWEEADLTEHPEFVDVRFLAADKQLTLPPGGGLRSNPSGVVNAWEQFTLTVDEVGAVRIGRSDTTVVLEVEGYSVQQDLPPLSRRGLDIVTPDGQRHVMIGSTELLLAWRYDQGDDIRPVLAERQAFKFNNLRVLLQKDIGNTGHSPWQMPIAKLRPFLALCAEYGFYVEGVILADCQIVNPSFSDQERRVNEVRHETAGVSNLIEQLGNEYGQNGQGDTGKNGFDPWKFSKPTDRLAANASSTEGGKDAPYWDFFCFSGQRKPLGHAIREYGPIEFMYSDGHPWGGVPALCDECFKPGEESSDPMDYYRAGAHARAGIGGRFHTDAGTKGSSRLFNDLEKACAEAFVQGLRGTQ